MVGQGSFLWQTYPLRLGSLVIFKGMILLSFPKGNMGNLQSQDYGFRGSITLAKAEGKTSRLLFHVNFRGFTRVIVRSHQRTSTRRFWWQYSVLGSEYPLGDSRFRCWNSREIMQQHLYNLGKVGPIIWILFPTWSYNQSQILRKVFSTGPHILRQ